MRSLVALVFAVVATACAGGPEPAAVPVQSATRTAWLVGAQGTAIGQVRFREAGPAVLIQIDIAPNALPQQWYAVSLTDRGDCSDFGSGFDSAGVVIGADSNPNSAYRPPPGAGDLPPFEAPATGPLRGELRAPQFALREQRVGDRWPLLDDNGSALVLSAGVEQYGPAQGARIACAALTRLP